MYLGARFVNDRSKAQLLWRLSEGYRITFVGAIGSMTIGYVFMAISGSPNRPEYC